MGPIRGRGKYRSKVYSRGVAANYYLSAWLLIHCGLHCLEARMSAMCDDLSFHGKRQAPAFSPGDMVQVASGTLAGLKGKVALIRDSQRCLVSIDGWPEGTHLMVPNHSLVRLDACSSSGDPK